MAAIDIDWAALGKAAGVSLVFAVGIIVVFTVGVLGVSRVQAAREDGTSSGPGFAMAGTAFVVSAAAVLYGLYLLIPQFH